jgi:hypothetical protein
MAGRANVPLGVGRCGLGYPDGGTSQRKHAGDPQYRHGARAGGPSSRSQHGLPVSAAQERPAGQAGSGVRPEAQGNLCSRLLLAPARRLHRFAHSEVTKALLAPEASQQRPAGSGQREKATRARLARARAVGVRDDGPPTAPKTSTKFSPPINAAFFKPNPSRNRKTYVQSAVITSSFSATWVIVGPDLIDRGERDSRGCNQALTNNFSPCPISCLLRAISAQLEAQAWLSSAC